jgi:CHASE2 domain-containing sensor protein
VGGTAGARGPQSRGDFRVPLTAQGELVLYFDRDRPERYVSARDILDPAKAEAVRPKIEGQIVFVGTSAAGLLDQRVTALGELVPGVSIHAQAAEQILAQEFLQRPDWADGLETIITVVLCLVVTVLLLTLGARYAAAVIVAAVGAHLRGGLVRLHGSAPAPRPGVPRALRRCALLRDHGRPLFYDGPGQALRARSFRALSRAGAPRETRSLSGAS